MRRDNAVVSDIEKVFFTLKKRKEKTAQAKFLGYAKPHLMLPRHYQSFIAMDFYIALKNETLHLEEAVLNTLKLH